MKTPGRIGLNDLFAGGDVLSELTRASPGSDGASPYLWRCQYADTPFAATPTRLRYATGTSLPDWLDR